MNIKAINSSRIYKNDKAELSYHYITIRISIVPLNHLMYSSKIYELMCALDICKLFSLVLFSVVLFVFFVS